MKKWFWIVVAATIVMIGIIFFRSGNDDIPDKVDMAVQTSYPQITSEETDTGKMQASDSDYDIYKGQEPVRFEELDENEQFAVSFIAEFYNVEKGETEEEFQNRVSPYLPSDTKFFLSAFNEADRLPEFKVRGLKKVYMLPEYWSSDKVSLHVIPIKVYYEMDGQEFKTTFHLGVAYFQNEGKVIGGHVDGHAKYFEKIAKKYNLVEPE